MLAPRSTSPRTGGCTSTVAELRAEWSENERAWGETIDRARALDPALLHESVDGEWSFIETLRHLSYATAAWLLRAIHGDPAPWHPLDLPWDEMPDIPGVPRDREVRPSLDEVLALRATRTAAVRAYLDELTEEALASETSPIADGSWPGPRAYPVRECLWVIFNEEREHRRFAERDLAQL